MVQFYMLQLDCFISSYFTQPELRDIEWPSFAALLHTINIPPVTQCITRYTLYFDTQLHGILPWADINRNGNIFFGRHWSAMGIGIGCPVTASAKCIFTVLHSDRGLHEFQVGGGMFKSGCLHNVWLECPIQWGLYAKVLNHAFLLLWVSKEYQNMHAWPCMKLCGIKEFS